MFHTVLVANRGEICVRAISTLKRLNIQSVAVYSTPDANSEHVRLADIAISLDGVEPIDTYLSIPKILSACKKSGAQAVFPGYGFLSENAEFAEACEEAGIVFLGPTSSVLRDFGLKHRARELAEAAEVPISKGTKLIESVEEALREAESLRYPIMVKTTAGGGGIGLTPCKNAEELSAAYENVKRMGGQFFGDAGLFLERFIQDARHIEVQIFGDGKGNVVALGERDCSSQRRNQKVIEETPAPNLPELTRKALLEAALKLAKSVNYRSAGTVEFIYEANTAAPPGQGFFFLEVNTRLQVEHGITEMVNGIDLVEWMLRVGAGLDIDFDAALKNRPGGAAIETRIYAENSFKNFQPCPGILIDVKFPSSVRVDTWVKSGTEVSKYFDPLVAKVIAYGANREEARVKMIQALREVSLHGIVTNIDFCRSVIETDVFKNGSVTTRFLDNFLKSYNAPYVEIIEPGTMTTIQDYPGRTGYWDIGVPPSGPMDNYAFRLGNRLLGNPETAPGLECTLMGPNLKFHKDQNIVLTGGSVNATIGGEKLKMWIPTRVKAGDVVKIGRVLSGCRTYLLIENGFDAPLYLGSRSTFALGNMGGHTGKQLQYGDMLPVVLGELSAVDKLPVIDNSLIPSFSSNWNIGVLLGPHAAPDYFEESYLTTFFAAHWEVSYNSNRLGIRLIGPKPTWTRSTGGEAGLHPSNIHDCEYAIGSINFTGDAPVILANDGPSLGGFVCPVTIPSAELWKIGQLKPGDTIRFHPISYGTAVKLRNQIDQSISSLKATQLESIIGQACDFGSEILSRRVSSTTYESSIWRQAGDSYILVEYGNDELNLASRLRVHLLVEAIRAAKVPVEELSPGVRSLQIRYDGRKIAQPQLLETLLKLDESLPPVENLVIPSRTLWLPMAFEDSATLDAVERYKETVRHHAPWLPSNTEFIRRINGLKSIEDVKACIFSSSIIVLGLGDVYLGAPCMVPLDPRHRLLSSKYNPARTFTAEGTVGIGGMYYCIYGMDSPGGYQLVGRTLPIWNKFLKNDVFESGKPWLLRFFDQVRFYEVDEKELDKQRHDFLEGKCTIKIEDTNFSFKEYSQFLSDNASSIAEFHAQQNKAFNEEVQNWKLVPDEEDMSATNSIRPKEEEEHDEHRDFFWETIHAPMHGNVWKVLVKPGDVVTRGQTVAFLEAMKMQLAVESPVDGTIISIRCSVGHAVSSGKVMMYVQEASSNPLNKGKEEGEVELNSDVKFTVANIHEAYKNGVRAEAVVALAWQRLEKAQDPGIFIDLIPRDDVLAAIKALPAFDPVAYPLWGVPCAVKDNIDVAGRPTTAACPAFAFTPTRHSKAVELLLAAGAVVLGKTNLDQFATGLVGVRSPYPIPRNPYDASRVPGGSSSGSAVSVSRQIVCFSLGTDTAGSGRVPAGLNDLVGLKPSVGVISTRGLLPACRTLDCISIFATSVSDARRVFDVLAVYDDEDSYARPLSGPSPSPSPSHSVPAKTIKVLGVPRPQDLLFFGDSAAAVAFDAAIAHIKSLGFPVHEIDMTPFFATARLLYEGPWVAERKAAVQEFMESKPDAMHSVTRAIINNADKISAVDAFKAFYSLADKKRETSRVWSSIDALVVPTAPLAPRLEDLERDPIGPNSQLGTYTNFVNLLDLSGLAVPGPFRSDGIPAGVTFIAPFGADHALASLGEIVFPGVGARNLLH